MSKKAQHMTSARHVFVCCQGSDCEKHGAHETLKTLRAALRDAGLKNEVPCVKSECVGLCKHGPIVMVCGSHGTTWYRKIKAKDAVELVQSHIVAGNPLTEKQFSE